MAFFYHAINASLYLYVEKLSSQNKYIYPRIYTQCIHVQIQGAHICKTIGNQGGINQIKTTCRCCGVVPLTQGKTGQLHVHWARQQTTQLTGKET